MALKKIIILLLLLSFFNCKNESTQKITKNEKEGKLTLKYANGFSVTDFGTHKLLEITNPWPESDKEFTYLLQNEDISKNLTEAFNNSNVYQIKNIKKIVVTSTTHIPALELLGVEHTLVGFPGTDYISSKKTRTRIDNGEIRELGKNEGINTEVLLELQPDVVVAFGIDGNNKTFEIIKKSGIPVIYNGDWVEKSPLAKAEWIKFFGALYNKTAEADSIFNSIEKEYNDAKLIASKVRNTPTVLSGALHKDVWYLPSGTSPEAQLLKDANVNYLWRDVAGEGSLALNFEAVFNKAKQADIWLSPSYYNSLKALKNANDHYTEFNAFKNKHVYSFVNTVGPTGGVTYYEEGTARPDLVLKDIIKVCHPELLPEYETHFFKPLE